MQKNIANLLQENRSFPPPPAFEKQANIKWDEYQALWQKAKDHPEEFWGAEAKKRLHWHKEFKTVLSWNCPDAQWFADGELNASYNCLDRHLGEDKTAIIWEGEPGDQRSLTYKELHAEVCRCANVLKKLGLKKGDRVTLYMPLVPELAISVLACARLGLVHSVVFAGFSAESLAERNNNAEARLVITADGGFRRGKTVPLKANVDESLKHSKTVEKVLVLKRTGEKVVMTGGRDFWWHEEMATVEPACEAVPLPAEHPLFILYTSGSTGKPKGVFHTTGGYLLGATLSSHLIFDFKPKDIFWCTADIGWITGHTYVVYGPLANGTTIVMYEGAPDFPEPDRMWDMIERHKVTIFYTAPTAIRAFMKWGDKWVKKRDLSSLRLLGTVGEPINPEAWMWYREQVGGSRCPIIDTWWQTETGSAMITPLPGATPTVPGTATLPFLGIVPDIVDQNGNSLPANTGGYLVIRKPWPSMLRGVWGDPKRFREQYWSQIPGCYFTGDGARRDEHGNFWIMGRIDDVINVSGHRLSTMEIESTLVQHKAVAEAAVVGKPDAIKGEVISCFVILKNGFQPSKTLEDELKAHVAKQIGALARPEEIRFADALPKTRSGKIMRRFLRDIAGNREPTGDTTTLEGPGILESLRQHD